ncbi:MAG: hypothetical protein L0Y79_12810 [Chlorobi bacterium]|nr:hypothetical protein [Chlorobiota bacterium]
MKHLMLFSFVLSFIFLFGCKESVNEPILEKSIEYQTDEGGYDTLDLSVDPCQVGGMTQTQIDYYIDEEGYTQNTLSAADLCEVQFYNSTAGYYFKIGYVRAGTLMLEQPGGEGGLCTPCGNVYTHDYQTD